MYNIKNHRGQFVTRNQYPLAMLKAVIHAWYTRIGVKNTIFYGLFIWLTIVTWLPPLTAPIIIQQAHAEQEVGKVALIEVYIDWTPERIAKEVDTVSEKYGVSAKLMSDIIACESQGSTTIQSYQKQPYGREKSFGLAQIHLPAHPNVTKEEATDPQFAIDFLGKNLKQNPNMWSCYKMVK